MDGEIESPTPHPTDAALPFPIAMNLETDMDMGMSASTDMGMEMGTINTPMNEFDALCEALDLGTAHSLSTEPANEYASGASDQDSLLNNHQLAAPFSLTDTSFSAPASPSFTLRHQIVSNASEAVQVDRLLYSTPDKAHIRSESEPPSQHHDPFDLSVFDLAPAPAPAPPAPAHTPALASAQAPHPTPRSHPRSHPASPLRHLPPATPKALATRHNQTYHNHHNHHTAAAAAAVGRGRLARFHPYSCDGRRGSPRTPPPMQGPAPPAPGPLAPIPIPGSGLQPAPMSLIYNHPPPQPQRPTSAPLCDTGLGHVQLRPLPRPHLRQHPHPHPHPPHPTNKHKRPTIPPNIPANAQDAQDAQVQRVQGMQGMQGMPRQGMKRQDTVPRAIAGRMLASIGTALEELHALRAFLEMAMEEAPEPAPEPAPAPAPERGAR